jgi:hypothetical protein
MILSQACAGGMTRRMALAKTQHGRPMIIMYLNPSFESVKVPGHSAYVSVRHIPDFAFLFGGPIIREARCIYGGEDPEGRA